MMLHLKISKILGYVINITAIYQKEGINLLRGKDLMSFYWIFANASQIWSTLDGYEKLADKLEAISNGLKHEPATFLGICTCLIGAMVKKASF